MKFVGRGFQKLEPEQDTHTQTDATEHITTLHSPVLTIAYCLYDV